MIVRETVKINRKNFVRTYSDKNVKITRDGAIYCEAYDPAAVAEERVYTETDIVIPVDEV